MTSTDGDRPLRDTSPQEAEPSAIAATAHKAATRAARLWMITDMSLVLTS